MTGYVKTIREFLGDSTYDQTGATFTMLRLALSKVIGHNNGNLLFVDHKNKETIYIFHPSGGDLTKTSLTLTSIINNG